MTPGEKKMEQWSREKVYAELTGILQTLFETDAVFIDEYRDGHSEEIIQERCEESPDKSPQKHRKKGFAKDC